MTNGDDTKRITLPPKKGFTVKCDAELNPQSDIDRGVMTAHITLDSAYFSDSTIRLGHSRLWGWFGLGRSSFLVMPRVLMHEMSDEWQGKMAALLEEYDETWDWTTHLYGYRIQTTKDGRWVKTPEWLINYRRPNMKIIESLKWKKGE